MPVRAPGSFNAESGQRGGQTSSSRRRRSSLAVGDRRDTEGGRGHRRFPAKLIESPSVAAELPFDRSPSSRSHDGVHRDVMVRPVAFCIESD